MSTTTELREAAAAALGVEAGTIAAVRRAPAEGRYEVQDAMTGQIVVITLAVPTAEAADPEDGNGVDYDALTVPELDTILEARDLPRTGNKAEKVARLEEADAALTDPTGDVL